MSFQPPKIGDVYSGVIPPVRRDITTPQRKDLFIPPVIEDPIYVAEPAALPSTILSGDNPNDPTPPTDKDVPPNIALPPVLPLMAPDKPVLLADLNLTHLPEVQDSPPKGGNVTW